MKKNSLSITAFFLLGVFWCSQAHTPPDNHDTDGGEHAETHKVDDADHGSSHKDDHPRPYDAERDAWADFEATVKAAELSGKRAIVVMGANWCHDSRGLAYYFEKPDFRAENITPYFEQVYIDVGEKNRNIDLAQHLGVDSIVGTPTVFILENDGAVLNLDTAPTWRNAASRSEEEIIEYFKGFRE